MEKMTIANKFDEVIALLNGEESALSVEDAVDFINDRKEKAQKKAGNRKPTATQKENEVLKDAILDVLTDKGITISDMLKTIPKLEGYSNQKVSALMRQLVLSGKVVRVKEGKTTLFALAD